MPLAGRLSYPSRRLVPLLCFAAFGTAALPGRAAADDTAPKISLSVMQQTALRRLVETDAEAGALFARFERTAKSALDAAPNPIALIQTEGKLQTDPVKVQTQHSLGDIPKIAALAWTAVVRGKGASDASDPYVAKAKTFLLAWADVNRSKGDPIDDTNLEPMIVAYDLTRGAFTPEEQARMATYLRQVAGEEARTGLQNKMTSRNNWNSHRLKIRGLIAFLLQDKEQIADIEKGYQRQVDINLLPDGSSLDFHERDALHYHLYDLQPLLTLAIAARRNGIDLYSYTSPQGASLGKSIAWLLPFCDGSQTHGEFVNSKVPFDRKRAESGDAHYKAGRLFEPRDSLAVLALAAAFDPSPAPKPETLEHTIAGKPSARFVSWQDVLNAVERGK